MRRSRVRYSLECLRTQGRIHRSGWSEVAGHRGTVRHIPIFDLGNKPEPRPPSGRKDTSRLDFRTGAHLQGIFR
jgi:hypothetical protein